jgi:hypothetical protein
MLNGETNVRHANSVGRIGLGINSWDQIYLTKNSMPDVLSIRPNIMTSESIIQNGSTLTLPYRASPTMFRAHPFAFTVSLLLAPLVVGIIVLSNPIRLRFSSGRSGAREKLSLVDWHSQDLHETSRKRRKAVAGILPRMWIANLCHFG